MTLDVMRKFLSPTFDEVEYANSVIASNSVEQVVEKLSRGVNELDREIKRNVSLKHEELLGHLDFAEQLNQSVSGVGTGVGSLQLQISHIVEGISKPFEEIRDRANQLKRLQVASELGGAAELPKAAQSIRDIDRLLKETDMNGIELIDHDLPWFASVRADVWRQSHQIMSHGLHTQSQTDVATALQVFHNMDVLGEEVDTILARVLHESTQSLAATLDAKAMQSGRASFWMKFEQCLGGLHSQCVKIWHLHRVLESLQDPITLTPLSEIGNDDQTLPQSFFKTFTDILRDQLTICIRQSTGAENLFVSYYPKLINLLKDFWRRLAKMTQTEDDKMQLQLLQSVAFLRKDYVAFISRKLQDVVMAVCSSSPLDSSRMQMVVDAIGEELGTAAVDDGLLSAIALLCGDIIKTLASRCDAMIHTDNEAVAVSASVSQSQRENVQLFNAVSSLHASLVELLDVYSDEVAQPILDSLSNLERVARRIGSEMFDAFAATLDRVIMRLHREDFSRQVDGRTSDYIHELKNKISTMHKHVIKRLTDSSLTRTLRRNLAEHVLAVFVRNMALIRNLSESSRLVLGGDIAELELAIASIMPVKDLGPAYRALKAFRVLLFLTPEDVLNRDETLALPPSVIMHHLVSHAPSVLVLPHTHKNWTVAKYSEWLDSHSEEEICALIKETIKACLAKSKQPADIVASCQAIADFAEPLLVRYRNAAIGSSS